jgi:enoyl-CoA hydratase/carnithine racemase
MTFSTVLFDVRDHVAWLTLNRPNVLNAYSVQMRDDLAEILGAVRDDSEIRALVIQGAGRAFCAGADLTEFGTAPSPTVARRVRFARDVWATLYGLDIPTIAAVHGYVFGSGLEMALFCDLRIAADGTQFAMPEVQRGLIPAAGGTQTLPRVCGVGWALDILLTGRRFDAAEALRLGIVTEVVPDDNLPQRAADVARHLISLPQDAVRAVRRAVREGVDLPLQQGLRLEARLAATLRGQMAPMENAT